MKFSTVFLIILASVCYPVSGYQKSSEPGDFDAALLQIEEGRYLGARVPNVQVVTALGSKPLLTLVAQQPTILLFVYFSCGHACPVTMANLANTLRKIERPHRVVVLSFDVRDNLDTVETARTRLPAGSSEWTFGILAPADIKKLTKAVGFRFFFSESDQMFVHPKAQVFLSPAGEVMRYLYGTNPRVQDIELALLESRNRTPRLNEFVDIVKLICFQFDKSRGRYVVHPTLIFGSVGIGVLGITGLVAFRYKA